MRLYRPEFIADLAKGENDRRERAKIARAGGYSARVIEGLRNKRRKENETEEKCIMLGIKMSAASRPQKVKSHL